jgi:hypothetical protein
MRRPPCPTQNMRYRMTFVRKRILNWLIPYFVAILVSEVTCCENAYRYYDGLRRSCGCGDVAVYIHVHLDDVTALRHFHFTNTTKHQTSHATAQGSYMSTVPFLRGRHQALDHMARPSRQTLRCQRDVFCYGNLHLPAEDGLTTGLRSTMEKVIMSACPMCAIFATKLLQSSKCVACPMVCFQPQAFYLPKKNRVYCGLLTIRLSLLPQEGGWLHLRNVLRHEKGCGVIEAAVPRQQNPAQSLRHFEGVP